MTDQRSFAPAIAPGLGVLLTRGTGPVASWRDASAHFRDLEDLGCSAIWLADHLFWGVAMPDPLVLAGIAAAATRRCHIGTGVLQLPLHEPLVVAKAASTLQEVSGGRFVLGVGSGSHRREYERVGVDFTRRGRILDAGIDQIRSAWADPDDDDWYRQRPTPAPIPIWVGGHSEAALGRAAAAADGWMPIFLTADRYGATRQQLEALVAAAGRPAGSVAMAAVAFASVTGPGWTRDDALAWGAQLWNLDPARLDRYLVSGTAEQCVAGLRSYVEAGAGHVSLLLAADDPIAMFGHIAREWAAPA